jgi:hypothetical protein
MAMEREIIYAKEVEVFLDKLLIVLFEEGYFGFPESAKSYVDKLLDYLEQHIGIFPGRATPPYFNRYAENMKYITYHANRRTTWYIFYQQHVNIFLMIMYNLTTNKSKESLKVREEVITLFSIRLLRIWRRA